MIKLLNVHKTYYTKFTKLHVLKGVNLCIDSGEIVSIMGASGSGKSTLLNILGLLDRYDEGEYFVGDKLMKNLSVKDASLYRNKLIGFVFQSSNLIAYKNILENVALPLYYQGVNRKIRNILAMEKLDIMGLKEWATHFPNELSGGQRQRSAIARAIITNPRIILADEPTGQLDSETSTEVIKTLNGINSTGTTVIIVTHELSIAEKTNRIIRMYDGLIK